MYRHPVFFLTTYTGEQKALYERLCDTKLKNFRNIIKIMETDIYFW